MQWTAVDDFLAGQLDNEPQWLGDVRAANADADLPDIAVSVQQGAFLAMLVQLSGAKNILEVGTLGGYSTLCMANAAGEDGHIVTLEVDAANAAQSRRNFDAAGMGSRIELIEGDARETITALTGPFDFAFIDADKRSNSLYLAEALRMARPGALIIVDNIVRNGNVVDGAKTDANTQGARDVIAAAGAEEQLAPVGLQLVGSKGWDGMLLCRVIR